jgi:hypothetical protein
MPREEKVARVSGILVKLVFIIVIGLIGAVIGFHFGSNPAACAGTHASVLCFQKGR